MGKTTILLIGIFEFFFTCCTYKYHVKEDFIFHPPADKEYPEALKNQVFSVVTEDSLSLEGICLKHPAPVCNIIYFQGNGSVFMYNLPFLKEFSDSLRANIYVINYRGYGNNAGKPTIRGLKIDAKALYEHVRSQERGLPLVLIGFSLGGFPAGSCVDRDHTSALILISTFTNASEMSAEMKKKQVPFILKPFVKVVMDKTYDSLSISTYIQKSTKPLLIIHGTGDDIISSEMGEKNYKRSPSVMKDLLLIKKAGHGEVLENAGYRALVMARIRQFLKRSINISY